MEQPIRVLLADDHPLIREGICNRLRVEEGIEVVAEAVTGAEALRLAREHTPDVMILDMELPDMKGTEVAERLRERQSPVRVLGLSAHDHRQYVLRLLELGAAGYLTKEAPVERVVEAVRGIASGEEGWLSRRAAHVLMNHVNRQPDDRASGLLSEREREVLLLIAEGHTNDQIANLLHIARGTVKKHINNIYGKIGVSTRAEAVSWTWREGLIES